MLEANRVAWGCSTRNGGQGQNAAGRLSRSQWIERWGRDIALRLHAEIQDGFETFEDLISSGNIDCEPQRGGHLYIAHRQRKLDHSSRNRACRTRSSATRRACCRPTRCAAIMSTKRRPWARCMSR